MKEVDFIAYGPITGKQRPRFRRMQIKGKNGKKKEAVTTYTPSKTKKYEALISDSYKKAYSEIAFPEGPVELEAYFFFSMPQSWSKKKRAEMFNTPCLKKPDLDNCIKSIQDGLNGVAVTDDSQISDFVRCCKRWSEKEYTIVRLREAKEASNDEFTSPF